LKKVIDANFLRDPALESYLTDPQNFVVLTDFAAMESYKGDSLLNLQKTYEIVSNYPSQVIVLKSTRIIIANQHAFENLSGVELEDLNQTKGFSDFCNAIRTAKIGDAAFESRLSLLSDEANNFFVEMLNDASLVRIGIKGSFSSGLVDTFRKNKRLSESEASEAMGFILEIAYSTMKDHPDVKVIPRAGKALTESHLFRYCIAVFVLAKWWNENGGIDNVKLEKLRNDVVDITYVAYATRFDGFLSNDKKANEIFEETKWLIDNVFINNEGI
jgi:hypothetical protein